MPVSKKQADHVVGRVLGVKEGDSKIDAARKVIETMKMAGLPTNKAEQMLADAIARGVR